MQIQNRTQISEFQRHAQRAGDQARALFVREVEDQGRLFTDLRRFFPDAEWHSRSETMLLSSGATIRIYGPALDVERIMGINFTYIAIPCTMDDETPQYERFMALKQPTLD